MTEINDTSTYTSCLLQNRMPDKCHTKNETT